jgi:predicted CXXCH cytochrome family protein
MMALALVAGFSAISYAQIAGTAHDMSANGWSGGKICAVCHTPHNSDTSVAEAPLWDHEVTAAVFTLYSTTTLDAVLGQPAGVSKLCLSCHDGTVALDNFGGTTTGTSFVSGDALVGIDLGDDHPVSFTYNDALAGTDGGLNLPASALSGLGGTIDADMLFAGRLECASCHNVHDDSISPFLKKDNAGSALCLTCHSK